jgi:4-amino-4-deoxy-L-arabinose transferase-like glycosyltransferase
MKDYFRLSNFVLVLLAVTFWWAFTVMERPRLGWFYYLAFFTAVTYGYLKWGKASAYRVGADASSERISWLALGVVISGALLRLFWVRYSVVEQTSDFQFYANMAEQVYRGEYLLTPRKQSGPALVGAALYTMLGGVNVQAYLYLQAIVSTVTIWLVYLVTKRVFNEKAGLLAALVFAVNPEAWVYTNVFGNEPFIALFFTLSVWAVGEAMQAPQDQGRRAHLWMALAGLSLGLSQYMRATALIMALCFVAYLIMVARYDYRKVLSLFGVFTLVTAPILAFNYQKLGILSYAPSQYSGFSLLIGTKKETQGRYYGEFLDEVAAEIRRQDSEGSLDIRQKVAALVAKSGLSEAECAGVISNQIAMQMALDRIRKDGPELLRIGFTYKIPVFFAGVNGYSWSLETSSLLADLPMDRVERWLESFTRVLQYLMLVAGVVTLAALVWVGREEDKHLVGMIAVCTIAFGVMHGFVEVQPKYHYSILSAFPIVAFGCLRYSGAAYQRASGYKWARRLRL